MNPITIQTLLIAAALFAFGAIGFLTRKNMILMFLSIELMLAGVATNFIAFGAHHGNYQGQLFAILILTVASCEAAIALALVVALYRRKPTLDIVAWSDLRETDGQAIQLESGDRPEEPNMYPKLTPAGSDPLMAPVPSGNDHQMTTQKA